MANFKRKYPRTHMTRHGNRGRTHWLNCWPAAWDRMFNTRPARRHDSELTRAILRNPQDADDATWYLGNHKPHNCYW